MTAAASWRGPAGNCPTCPDCGTVPRTGRDIIGAVGAKYDRDLDERAACLCLGTPHRPTLGPQSAWKYVAPTWKRWSAKRRGWRNP